MEVGVFRIKRNFVFQIVCYIHTNNDFYFRWHLLSHEYETSHPKFQLFDQKMLQYHNVIEHIEWPGGTAISKLMKSINKLIFLLQTL
jgi:hypothetical protein